MKTKIRNLIPAPVWLALLALNLLLSTASAPADPLGSWSRVEFNIANKVLPVPLSSTGSGMVPSGCEATNGTAWDWSAGTNYLNNPVAIAWGSANFAAVGGGDWNSTNLITAGTVPRGLIFTGGKFVVVGDGGANFPQRYYHAYVDP